MTAASLATTLQVRDHDKVMEPYRMTYYGRFYRTELHGLLKRINTYLVRWARRKFKRLRAFKRAKRWWHGLLQRQPALFTHRAWMTEF